MKKPGKKIEKQKSSFPIIRTAGFEITFPDLITALNLCSGVTAIFSAIRGEAATAIILVVAGMIFDYFDGKIARAYKLSHEFGRELDSLADVVTFGLAPGIIILSLFPNNLILLWAAALYAIAAAFRLARFNLLKASETITETITESAGRMSANKMSGKKKRELYLGLPVPAAAFLILLGVVVTRTVPLDGWINAPILILGAIMMVSTVKVPKI